MNHERGGRGREGGRERGEEGEGKGEDGVGKQTEVSFHFGRRRGREGGRGRTAVAGLEQLEYSSETGDGPTLYVFDNFASF